MKTVLIVDDEKLFLASLTEGLAAHADEFAVVTANNGKQAVGVLKSHTIDLVVTDLKMPVMDGFQLLAHLMQNNPDIPAIVMTAFGTAQIEDNLNDLGAFGYLEKPIDFQTLADKIRQGLGGDAEGQITGITLFSFLQLLQIERKSCSLKIKSRGREGTLYFADGDLIDAAYEDQIGEAAAVEIVCWEEAEIKIINLFKKMQRRIEKPLPNILMEAAQAKDEAQLDTDADAPENSLEPATPALLAQAEFADSLAPPEAPDEIFDSQILTLPNEAQSRTAVSAARRTNDVANEMLDILDFDNSNPNSNQEKEFKLAMANNVNASIDELMAIEGALAAALVDTSSGMALGAAGSGLNLDVAAAGNSEVVKSKMKVMGSLGLKDKIEDILITLGGQYHLIRPLVSQPNLFFYLALNRTQANLAMARFKLSDIEKRVEV